MTREASPDPVSVAMTVAQLLDRLGVAYLIGGSFASSLHGEPRSTNDVDVVADLTSQEAPALVAALRSDFYVSDAAVDEAVRTGTSFNVVHLRTAVKVDIFVAGADAFDRERLSRRKAVLVPMAGATAKLFVDTAEDTVLRKLEWYRRGGESRFF